MADGEVGEILIKSRFIANGYWKAPDLTAAAFTRDRSDESTVTFKTGELIKSFNAEGMTVLVVEHDMAFVRQIAQRVTVLHLGKIFARGSLETIIQDEKVAEIYLGKTHAH